MTEDRSEDARAVRAFWEPLGLPGLFDVHTHFLPPNIQRAVWRVFDEAGPKIGRPWPIRYRQSLEERVALLRAFGVRAFPTHPYAHKPGVASYLNDWSRDFAATAPEILPRGSPAPGPVPPGAPATESARPDPVPPGLTDPDLCLPRPDASDPAPGSSCPDADIDPAPRDRHKPPAGPALPARLSGCAAHG